MDDSVLLSCPPYLPAGRRFSVVKNTMEAQRSRRFTENTQRTKNHEVPLIQWTTPCFSRALPTGRQAFLCGKKYHGGTEITKIHREYTKNKESRSTRGIVQ